MNGIQRRKAQNIEKPFPGCLGSIVNLFYLSNGMARNRLLTDKPHRDGPSIFQSDMARIVNASSGDQIEDKMIVSELRRSSSNKKANGTPMKTLIAHEMSKEVVSKHNPPNVVAKLMGLDTLPDQQPNPAARRSHSRDYSRRSLSHSGRLMGCWEQDNDSLGKQISCESHHYQEHNEYKDVNEVWQQSQKTTVRDSSSQKGRYNPNEKNMALVRKKFIEAKRLSTDEKGRQSKEFEDALEVLSSNKDLFLKFLQEPDSLFSQQLYNSLSNPQSPETKRITVLKPSKMIDSINLAESGKKSDKKTKKPAHTSDTNGWDEQNLGYSCVLPNQISDNFPAQPTRIVVLRPSPGKLHDINSVVSGPCSSPRMVYGKDFLSEHEDDKAQESRDLAKEITRHMHENLIGHQKDEILLSSVFSNGYIGDDSSFNKSVGNTSDSEIPSPTSRHSWDYINRLGSPYSSSSISYVSCSPESSVCREAKKRLSERWAMMASNGRSQERKTTRRSSSTLGEMLALSDGKKSMRFEEEIIDKEQKPLSLLTGNLNKEEGDRVGSPRNLLRSKSVPVSSMGFGAEHNVEISDHEPGKIDVCEELTKTKITKSSLKGKVSNLFFSLSKNSSRENSVACQFRDECQSAASEVPGLPLARLVNISGDANQCPAISFEDCLSPRLHGSTGNTTHPDFVGAKTKHGGVSHEGGLSVAKPVMPGSTNENQDQPSPVSVLEPPFEEDDSTIPEPSGNIKPDPRGVEVSFKSNLIDKSPLIGSIARTLSWDESSTETATPYPLKSSSSIPGSEEEEKDWFFLVKSLLSLAGLDGEVQSNSCPARWHSPESPLEPSLRDKYACMNDKELLHEAKRRHRRSNRKLMFDCVNAALVEITCHVSERSTRVNACGRGPHTMFTEGAQTMLVDHVWAHINGWFCSEVRCTAVDGGDSNSLVVEMMVGKEIVGKWWDDNMRAELDNLGNEIEEKLLEELVKEAVVDLTAMF